MTFEGVNYLHVLIAAVATWALGFAYYTAFSGPWLAAQGRTKADMDEFCKGQSGLAKFLPLVVVLVGAAVMSWVLAGLLAHLGPGQITLKNGVVSGAYCWLGFIVPPMAINNMFSMRSVKLTVIDSIYWLIALVVQGALIGGLASGFIWA